MDVNCTPNETFGTKLPDANSESYSGDVWYLKSDIPTSFFKLERDNDAAEFEKALDEQFPDEEEGGEADPEEDGEESGEVGDGNFDPEIYETCDMFGCKKGFVCAELSLVSDPEDYEDMCVPSKFCGTVQEDPNLGKVNVACNSDDSSRRLIAT